MNHPWLLAAGIYIAASGVFIYALHSFLFLARTKNDGKPAKKRPKIRM